MKRLIVFSLLTILLGPPLSAQTLEDEIGGILTNRTITRFGQQFYLAFTHQYRLSEQDSGPSLVIVERPSARWGSLIWVEHNNMRLYQFFWQPGKNGIEVIARKAVDEVVQRLHRKKLEQLLSDHFDLDSDEF